MKNKTENIARINFVSEKLGDLCNEIVFLGGSTVALLITDPALPDVRATQDVDCIIDVISLNKYHNIESQLRKKGFVQSIHESVFCRWKIAGIAFDIMPTDKNILKFGNRWYKLAFDKSQKIELDNKKEINVVSSPYFLATKLEAFEDRGQSDFMGSHDMEDIITVIDGRPEILDDISISDDQVRYHLAASFEKLLENSSFREALPGHLNYSFSSRARENIVIERIEKIITLK